MISITFLVGIEGVFSAPFSSLTRDYLFVVVDSPFLRVGLEEADSFFLKSTLRSLREEEYLVLVYFISLVWMKAGVAFLSDCLGPYDPYVFFLGSDCGVY